MMQLIVYISKFYINVPFDKQIWRGWPNLHQKLSALFILLSLSCRVCHVRCAIYYSSSFKIECSPHWPWTVCFKHWLFHNLYCGLV